MRYENLQVLRLAAAVAVVLAHLGMYARSVGGTDLPGLTSPWLTYIPVPVFFAVSGFVLAGAARSSRPGRFLRARFLRLYVGYWLAAAVVAGLATAGLLGPQYRAAVGLVNAHTVTLWPAGPGRVVYLLGVEWSLVYEAFLSVAVVGLAAFGPGRGLTALTAAWVAAIGVKMAGWPGLFFDQFPRPAGIALSAYNLPFLFGLLAYQVRDRGPGRAWPAAVGLGTLAVFGLVGPVAEVTPEVGWAAWGLASAGVVWLTARLPQGRAGHPLARLGDRTYGLFLVHVPILLGLLHHAGPGWAGHPAVLAAAGRGRPPGG